MAKAAAKKSRFRLSVDPQAKYLVFGVVIPSLFIWMAHWLVFSFNTKVQLIKEFLNNEQNKLAIESVLPNFTTPAVFEEVIFKLDSNNGLVFILLGILLFAIAITLMIWVGKRSAAGGVKLGELKLSSLLVSFVIGLVLVSLTVAALQQVLVYSFPNELKAIFWV